MGFRIATLRMARRALPAVLLLGVTLPKLWQADFRSDAGWYSAIGVQAWRTGSLWTLFAEPGQPYFNKPPLVFWIHGLVMHLFGVGALQSRVPTVVAGALCVIATARLVRDECGAKAGLWAGIILALSYDFFARCRDVSLDMWQTLFMVLALLIATRAVRRGSVWRFALSGVPIGLALMCKPLTALLVFPMLSVWLVVIGRARMAWWPVPGIFVAAAVAGPWHVSMFVEHGREFSRQYFGAEVIGRATGAIADATRARDPWWFYLSHIVQRYWPWLPAVAMGAVVTVRGRGSWLALVWMMGWLVLLSVFTDRRDRYSVPLYPGMAWLGGIWMSGWWRRETERRRDGETERSAVLETSLDAVDRDEPSPPPSGRGSLQRARRLGERWIGVVVAGSAVVVSVLPIRVHKAEPAQWVKLFEWVRGEGRETERRREEAMETQAEANPPPGPLPQGGGAGRVWQGAFQPLRGARLYLEFGWWPRTTRDRWGAIVARPPVGALLIYHRRDGLAPGPGEVVVFEEGDIKVTRLDGAWNPVERADPGE